MTARGRPLRIGVSACLLGQEVRWDGRHKRDPFLVDLLGAFVEYVPVCPELELGLGVPREAIHLVRRAGQLRLVGTRTDADHTETMRAYAAPKLAALGHLDVSGYVLKKGSPSCGMERVEVHHGTTGQPTAEKASGAFAQALLAAFPLLPVEEEGRLRDPRFRESFVERVFSYRRLRSFFSGRWTQGGLVELHANEKLLLMAHEPRAYGRLGRLVAGATSRNRSEVASAYREVHANALRKLATPTRHVNALRHAAGFFEKLASADERRELADRIEDYGRGLVPLVVPITLLRHHVRRHGVARLAGQVYLEPHPEELLLRNHA